MSTRCQIAIFDKNIQAQIANNQYQETLIQEWQALLYKHQAGYPENVLPLIQTFLKAFIEKRGFDCEYLAACLMAYFKQDQNKYIEINDDQAIIVDEIPINLFSYGICKEIKSDIDYFYAIFPGDNIRIIDSDNGVNGVINQLIKSYIAVFEVVYNQHQTFKLTQIISYSKSKRFKYNNINLNT